MGAKNSKAEDIFVTDEYTQSELPADAIRKYGGSPCEYASIDVCLDVLQDGNTKPNSLIKVLSDASKRNFGLCYITTKKDGQTMNFGRKMIWSEEEERAYLSCNSTTETTHTVVLNKDKLCPQAQKQQSLDRMEAKKTILNMMMEMHNRSAKFYVKQFAESFEDLDKIVKSLQRLISEEACGGATLHSVMRTNSEDTETLRLQLVFMLNKSKDEERVCEYSCELKKMAHVERALKVNKKKHPLPNSNRLTNITCQTDWLDLFKDDAKIVEVISLADGAPSKSKSGTKKIKKRSFDVRTIWIYEKPLKKCNFEGLVRQVWTPLDKTLHENIKKEVWHFGDFGWVLSTILVTPHIRMKGDGSDHCKCVLFFQRKSSVHGSLAVEYKEENLIENGEQTETNGKAISSPPKDKAKSFGLGMISQDDLTHTKLRHTPQADESNVHESANKQGTINILSGVQLKKVDREKIKSEQASQDQTVPWHDSLQRKREAVQRNELKKESTEDSLPKPTHAEQEIVLKLEEIKNKNTQEQVEVSPDIPFIDKDGSQDPLSSPPARDPVSEPPQPDVVETTLASELAPLAVPVKTPSDEASELQVEVREETVSDNNKSEVTSDINEDNMLVEVAKEKDEVNEKDEGVESKDDFSDYRIESRVIPSCLQQNLSQDEGIETCDSSKDMRSPDEETSVDFTKEDSAEDKKEDSVVEVTEKAKEDVESSKVEKPAEDVAPTEQSTSEIVTSKSETSAEDNNQPSEDKTSAAETTAIKVIAELLPTESKEDTSDIKDNVDMSATQSAVKDDTASQPEQVSGVEATDISTTTEIKEISSIPAVVETPKEQLELTKQENTAVTVSEAAAEVITEPSQECKDQLNISDSTKVVDLNETSEKEISQDETKSQVLDTVECEDMNVSQTDKISETQHIEVEASEVETSDKNENSNNNSFTLQQSPDTSILADAEGVVDECDVKLAEVSQVNESTEEETKPSKHEIATNIEEIVGELPQPQVAINNNVSNKSVTEDTPANVAVVESECSNIAKEEKDLGNDKIPVSEVVTEVLDDVSAECLQESDEQSRSAIVDVVDNNKSDENDVSTALQSDTEKASTASPEQVLMETKDTSSANILVSEVAEATKEQLEVAKVENTAATVSEAAADIITEPSQECKDQLNISDSTKVVDNDATDSVNENAAQSEEIATVDTSLKEASNTSEVVESSKAEVVESEAKETPEVQVEILKDETASVAVSELANAPKPEEITVSGETSSTPESSKVETVASEPKETPEVQAEPEKDETASVAVSELANAPKPEEITVSGETSSTPELSKVEVVESEPKETPEVVKEELIKDEVAASELPAEDVTKPTPDFATESPKLDTTEIVDNVSTTPVVDATSVDTGVVNASESKESSSTEMIELKNENTSQEQKKIEDEEAPISVSDNIAEIVKEPLQEPEDESVNIACSKPDDKVVAETNTSEPLQDGKIPEELLVKSSEPEVVEEATVDLSPVTNNKHEDVAAADISIKEVSLTSQIEESSEAEIVKSEPDKTEAQKDKAPTSVPDAIAEIVNAAYVQSKDELANPASVQAEVHCPESEKSECIKTLDENGELSQDVSTSLAAEVITVPPQKTADQLITTDISISEVDNSMSNEVVNDESEVTTPPAIKGICDTELSGSICNEDAKGEMEPLKTETTAAISTVPAQDITGPSETTINLLSSSEPTEVAAGKLVTEFVDEDASTPEQLVGSAETSLKEDSSVPEVTGTADAEVVKCEPSKNDESSVFDVVVKETPLDFKDESENQVPKEPESKESSCTEPTEKSESTVALEVQVDSPTVEPTTLASGFEVETSTELLNEDISQEQKTLSEDEDITSVSAVIADVVTEASQGTKGESVKPVPIESHIKATTVEEIEKSQRNEVLKENEVPSKDDDAKTEISAESSSEPNKLSEDVVTQMMAMPDPVTEDTQLENVVATVEDSGTESTIAEVSSETCDAKPASLESDGNAEEQPRSETTTVSAEDTQMANSMSETTISSGTENVEPEQVQTELVKTDLHTSVTEVVAEVLDNVSTESSQNAATDEQLSETTTVSEAAAEIIAEPSQECKDQFNTSDSTKVFATSADTLLKEAPEVQKELPKDETAAVIVSDSANASKSEQATASDESVSVPESSKVEVIEPEPKETPEVQAELPKDETVAVTVSEPVNTSKPEEATASDESVSVPESSMVEVIELEPKETPEVQAELPKDESVAVTVSEPDNTSNPEEETASGESVSVPESSKVEVIEPEPMKTPEVQAELPNNETVAVTISEPVKTSNPEEATASDESVTVPESKVEVIEPEPKETPEVQAELPKDEIAVVKATESVNASKPDEETAPGETSLNEAVHVSDVASTVPIAPSEVHIQQLKVDDQMSTAPSTSHDADSNIAATAIGNEEVLITESIPCDVNDEKKSVETEKARICDDKANHNESYASPTPPVASESSCEVVTTKQQSGVHCSTQGDSAVENDETQLKNEKAVDLVSDTNNKSLSPPNEVDAAAADQAAMSDKTEENNELLGENVIPDGNTQFALPSDCSASESCSAPQQKDDKNNPVTSVSNTSVGQAPQNEPVKSTAQVKETTEVISSLLPEANAGDTLTEAIPVTQEPQQVCTKGQKETSIEKDLTSANSSPLESCSTTGGDKHI